VKMARMARFILNYGRQVRPVIPSAGFGASRLVPHSIALD
jgi:hypothetical protein